MTVPRTATGKPRAIVSITNFQMKFGDRTVINNLSLTVNRGEVFGFLGTNGAGKTTTIRALLGLLTPTSGSLLIDGKRYSPAMSPVVGYLPEERGLYRNEPVLNTMVYFAMMHGLSKPEATRRSLRYLERVGLQDKAHDRLVSLSGGQQQKIQLGVTIIHEPSLMILDEPTEALDPVNRSLLMQIIDEQRAKGAAVMLVTHRMEEVEQLCDRIALLKDGECALSGTVDEVREKFGSQVIVLRYSGKLAPNKALYQIPKQLPHYAELTWDKKVPVDDILRHLSADHGLHITTFEVRRPSLNDIFLALYEQPEAGRGKN